jgi:hypothetical protein
MGLRHRVGWVGTAFLMLPVLVWTAWVAGDPLASVFHCRSQLLPSLISGELLAQRFDIRHAGGCFDQPTIGKWLFLFTLMAVTALPWALAVRWLSDRSRRGAYVAYAFCGTVLGVFLLCILVGPLVWLGQYVNTMGVTPRRVRGLVYGAAGGAAVIAFIVSGFARRNTVQERSPKQLFSAGVSVIAVIAAALGTLFVWVNGAAWAGRFYCLRCVNHQEVSQACRALMANTSVTNTWGSVSFGPKGKSWPEVPSALKLWNIQEICVYTNAVALVMNDRINRLVFLEDRTNAGLYELAFIDGLGGRRVLARANVPPKTSGASVRHDRGEKVQQGGGENGQFQR